MPNPMRRNPLPALLGALALAFAALAPARADDAADARQFIAQMADQAIALVDNTADTKQQKVDAFSKLFVASFDIPAIGQFVLGRHWKGASAEQQQQFLDLFRDFTVLTWTGRFNGYAGVRLDVSGAGPDPQDASVLLVDSKIVRASADPIPLQWRVHKTPAGWRIVDIFVEGVSMALTQRQDFASAIQSSGGTVDGLNAALRKKIEQMKAGG